MDTFNYKSPHRNLEFMEQLFVVKYGSIEKANEDFEDLKLRYPYDEGFMSNAVGACRAYNAGGFSDWYFPARNELDILFSKRSVMNNYNTYYYWSSTESTSYIGFASAINFAGGGTISDNSLKTQIYHVRAIRAF